jgi:DNA gyrase subunit A
MLGRITSGVKLINLDEGVKVAAISKVRKTPGADDEVAETETEEETEEE